MLRDELAQRIVGRKKAFLLGLYPHRTSPRTSAPAVLHFDVACIWPCFDRMGHGHAGIILAERNPRDRSNSKFRHQLADKNHTPFALAPHIEPEVNFFKRAVERNRHASDTCVIELEPHKADISAALECVEHRAQRNESLKHSGVNLVIEHQQVAPISGQEYAGLLHAVSFLQYGNFAPGISHLLSLCPAARAPMEPHAGLMRSNLTGNKILAAGGARRQHVLQRMWPRFGTGTGRLPAMQSARGAAIASCAWF